MQGDVSLEGYDAHLTCEAAPAPKTMEEMEKDEIRANEARLPSRNSCLNRA